MSFSLDHFLSAGALMSASTDRVLVAWGERKRLSLHDSQLDRPAFYSTDFFLKASTPWIQYSHSLEMHLDEFERLLSLSEPLKAASWAFFQPGQFKLAFEELMGEIQSGKLKKAVPYLFAHSAEGMTKERLCRSLKKALLTMKKNAGYLYGQWDENEGILGISPELLFAHQHTSPNIIETMAVAGTCHPSDDQEKFFHNEKERHEHQLVVEGISASLRSLGQVRVGSMRLLQLPKLVHLITPIELSLSSPFNFDQLVSALHPTPALGAFPAQEGKSWLSAFQEHTPRNLFGAPIGYIDPESGNSRCFVAIRNVQWNSAGMRIGAGCGVVEKSLFEKEWKEIQIKVRATRDQLCL